MNVAELGEVMSGLGEPGWRGRQVAEAIYRQRIVDVGSITTLPKGLRDRLTLEGWRVGRPGVVQVFTSVDGTERYLIQGPADALTVETVWMPEGDEGETKGGQRGAEEIDCRLTTDVSRLADLPSRRLAVSCTYTNPALRPGTCGKGEGIYGGRWDWGSLFALSHIYVAPRGVDS